MTCNCHNKENKEQECPEGQSFDVSQGKCVAKESVFGDPKADSVQGKLQDGEQDTGDVQKVEAKECPEGHKYDADADMCVPVAPEVPEVAATKAEIATESVPKWATELQSSIKSLTEKKPTATVSENSGEKTWKDIAESMLPSLEQYGKFEFNIPIDGLRNINTHQVKTKSGQVTESFRGTPLQIKEAVTITGVHATQDLDTDVAIVPGGITFKPVFNYAKVKRIGPGSDRARFFKTTIPSYGDQTAGTTVPAQGSQTFTSIEVEPSQISGVYMIGHFDDIEDSPFDLLQAIVEGSAASYEDYVATDMLDTRSKEGELTPGLWINAETGATIASSDTAGIQFTEVGLAFAREYLENQGYLRGGIKPVCFLHPKQWRELIVDAQSNVNIMATRSSPDIWLKAELEELMGIELVVTNAVENKTDQTNSAYNAIVCIPKHSYGIGIKRDVTVKMHEIPEDNAVRVNTTWRTKTGVLDSSSIVRITSSA